MSDTGGDTFVITNAGTVALPLAVPAELVGIRVNLGTAGSTATTVQVNKNGTSLGSGALVTLAASATAGSKAITNPYVGVNVVTPAVNAVAPLGTFAAGDTVTLTTTLGTSAANPGVSLLFKGL